MTDEWALLRKLASRENIGFEPARLPIRKWQTLASGICQRQLPLGLTQVFLSGSECFVYRGPDDPPLDNVHMRCSRMPSLSLQSSCLR